MTAAGDITQRLSALLNTAMAEDAHSERVQALREAYDIADAIRREDNRTRRDYYKSGELGQRRERLRVSQKRIRRNNETIDRATRRKQRWTDWEISTLERVELSNRACADLLGRTMRGVARKRESLGIRVAQSADN